MKKAGILGGMGPVSTIYFYDLIIKTFQKKYNAIYHSDYPYLVILNVPIPDNVEDLKQKEKMRNELIKAAKTLEKTGVDFIVMPCNTEHIFYYDIINNISTPMLNIIDETLKEVESEECSRVLLFSTSSTIRYKLYEKRDIELFKPTDKEQNIVDGVIYNLLAGKVLQEDADKLVKIAKKYDVEGIIVGCTELSILFDLIVDEIKDKKIFDSTKILARRTVKKIMVD